VEQTGTVDGVHDGTRPLEGMRVLDLTDHRGEVGPWLLAELGADVIKVEPPTGSPGRLPGPGADGAYDGQSLRFAAYNANKRSIASTSTTPPTVGPSWISLPPRTCSTKPACLPPWPPTASTR